MRDMVTMFCYLPNYLDSVLGHFLSRVRNNDSTYPSPPLRLEIHPVLI